MMSNIVVVDDEQRMLELIEIFLYPHDITCKTFTNGKDALRYLRANEVDAVLLDVMMPGLNGFEVCQAIRQFSRVPIIMLTAKSEKQDVIEGLNIGADDYITKPFDEDELVARLQALLRRTQPAERQVIQYQDFVLNMETFTLQYQTTIIPMTVKEFALIKAFLSRPNKAYSREELLYYGWEDETNTDYRTVDSHIRNLRDKLRKKGLPMDDYLLTVWGIGYRWQ